MLEKQDIHNYERRTKNIEKSLEALSEHNRKTILKFKSNLSVNNLGRPRILKYMEVMKCLSQLIEKDPKVECKKIDCLNKDEVKYLVGLIQERPYSPWTKQTYKIMIRKFFCWAKNCEDGIVPDEVKWLKTVMNKADIKLPGEGALITKEELDKAIGTCKNLRDKAFITTLYESGCRIGEVASLKIGNVIFDKYGVQLHVFGKTGARRIRLINASFLLRAFIESHPQKEDKNANLWTNTSHPGKIMVYATFKKILRVAFTKAGVKKRIYPHLFRHSRATEMASFLTEFQMNQYFGWSQGSAMPSTYIHMNGKEVDSAILAMNGIKETDMKEIENKPRVCQRCDFLNPSKTQYCIRCSLPLEMKAAVELEERENDRRKVDLIMDELIKQPEVQRLLLNKVKELGLNVNIIK